MSRHGCVPSQTVGPFYHFGLTTNAALGCMAKPEARGERIRLRFRVLDGDSLPAPDCMIELWQADASGKYDHPADPARQSADPAFCGFGRLSTEPDGACTFHTVLPGRVDDQAAHINVSLFARGLLVRLVTRVYFAGDPALAEDPVLALVPEERRPTLLARPDPHAPGQWNFEVRLQGEGETVFFEI